MSTLTFSCFTFYGGQQQLALAVQDVVRIAEDLRELEDDVVNSLVSHDVTHVCTLLAIEPAKASTRLLLLGSPIGREHVRCLLEVDGPVRLHDYSVNSVIRDSAGKAAFTQAIIEDNGLVLLLNAEQIHSTIAQAVVQTTTSQTTLPSAKEPKTT